MGVLSDVIDGLDQSGKITQQQEDKLAGWLAQAKDKADEYDAQIQLSIQNAGLGTNKTLPTNSIINSVKDLRAYAQSNADSIPDAISAALKSFFNGGSGDIVDGVTILLKGEADALFGRSSSTGSDFFSYYAGFQGFSLVRVDIAGWSISIEADSITDQIEQVSAFVGYLSTIDTSKLNFDAFSEAYQPIVLAKNPDMTMDDYLVKARKTYNALTGKSSTALQEALAM